MQFIYKKEKNMLNSLKSLVSNVYASPIKPAANASGYNHNPFENPFVQTAQHSGSYGINRPVKGGYFAGYYNGKPNIVGRKLFIEA